MPLATNVKAHAGWDSRVARQQVVRAVESGSSQITAGSPAAGRHTAPLLWVATDIRTSTSGDSLSCFEYQPPGIANNEALPEPTGEPLQQLGRLHTTCISPTVTHTVIVVGHPRQWHRVHVQGFGVGTQRNSQKKKRITGCAPVVVNTPIPYSCGTLPSTVQQT